MKGKASSFADLADVKAFNRCKQRGGSDAACFKVGDNGRGCWGDLTAQTVTPMCAVPPEKMIDRWGSINAAKHKKITVTVKEKSVSCVLADRMPHEANIRTGAVIDLNPAAALALGLTPPFLTNCEWQWE